MLSKIFEKITKGSGFHEELTVTDLEHLINETIEADINVRTNSLYQYVPIYSPDAQTQHLYNQRFEQILI